VTLAQIKPGDIVHVDIRGRRFHAVAEGKTAGGFLMIAPLSCRETYRSAKPREVIGHYRKAKGSA
jgi:hypothetical protein